MNQNNLIPAASFTPNLLQSPSAWLGHLPFASWVTQEVSPKIFVELGTHYGHSYFSFCQAVAETGISTKCYAVDTWQGDEHSEYYNDEVFAQVDAYHQEHYVGFSRLLRMTFDDAATYFADESIELLHIDGLHTYEAVRHDFETWLPKLASGAVVMFHDTNVRERNFGVWKLWEELQVRYPNNLEFVHSHGLGVLQLNNAPDDKKLDWLQPNSSDKQQLISYFAALGSRQFERSELNQLKQHIVNLNQAAVERDNHIVNLNKAAAERDTHIRNLNQALNQAAAERDTHIANLNQLVAERDAHIANLNQIYNEALKDIRGSSSWRITAPMRYISLKVKNIVRSIKSILSVIRSGGVIVNIKKVWRVFSQEGWSGVKQRISNRRKITLATVDMNVGRNSESNNIITNATQISHTCFQSVTPLRTYFLPESQSQIHRVNIVTDSISSGSLFGGVGTTLIFTALLANKLNAQLRIITRTERAKPENVDHILSLYGIKLNHEVQFKFAAFWDQKYELDITKNDLFITTSWWTTAATLPSVPNDKIIYLLQEDERMFYSFGDERFRCETILRNRDIRFIINTKLLFDHFVQDGFDNISLQATWFEPAFPSQIFHPRPKDQNEKHKFFFYARPNNQRNLFYLGIEVIEQAVLQQIIDLDLWEIYLVGKDIPNITFGNGYVPTKCQNLTWSEYADLVGTIDLGLSLMYTPHPSYPPLDLVASGAVVVTNQFANKRDLSCYSANLICAAADCDTLVEALRKAVTIAMDSNVREQNYHNNGLLTDWHQALDEIIQQLSGEL
ncbi:MAG: class I SAM-dependent methyltransferase [Methylococcales bacterium]|nr:class I SAM-dependent methyltransferase [Methylococcales bacterium]